MLGSPGNKVTLLCDALLEKGPSFALSPEPMGFIPFFLDFPSVSTSFANSFPSACCMVTFGGGSQVL